MNARTSSFTAILYGAALLAACQSDPGAPRVAAEIEIHAAATQSGTVGQDVPSLPAVRLTDASDLPVAGATVTWTVVEGGGSVDDASSVTNSDGVATVTG